MRLIVFFISLSLLITDWITGDVIIRNTGQEISCFDLKSLGSLQFPISYFGLAFCFLVSPCPTLFLQIFRMFSPSFYRLLSLVCLLCIRFGNLSGFLLVNEIWYIGHDYHPRNPFRKPCILGQIIADLSSQFHLSMTEVPKGIIELYEHTTKLCKHTINNLDSNEAQMILQQWVPILKRTNVSLF